jgi:hypothetical protein
LRELNDVQACESEKKDVTHTWLLLATSSGTLPPGHMAYNLRTTDDKRKLSPSTSMVYLQAATVNTARCPAFTRMVSTAARLPT